MEGDADYVIVMAELRKRCVTHNKVGQKARAGGILGRAKIG
ncbi:hypothetical protein [Saccharopolyspora pogona]|nr:hypothetical protein [Saccharopolyspora pogona]